MHHLFTISIGLWVLFFSFLFPPFLWEIFFFEISYWCLNFRLNVFLNLFSWSFRLCHVTILIEMKFSRNMNFLRYCLPWFSCIPYNFWKFLCEGTLLWPFGMWYKIFSYWNAFFIKIKLFSLKFLASFFFYLNNVVSYLKLNIFWWNVENVTMLSLVCLDCKFAILFFMSRYLQIL